MKFGALILLLLPFWALGQTSSSPVWVSEQTSLPLCTGYGYGHNCVGESVFDDFKYVGEFRGDKFDGNGSYMPLMLGAECGGNRSFKA